MRTTFPVDKIICLTISLKKLVSSPRMQWVELYGYGGAFNLARCGISYKIEWLTPPVLTTNGQTLHLLTKAKNKLIPIF